MNFNRNMFALSLALALFLNIYIWFFIDISGCPVSVGDRVRYQGENATVAAIKGTGGLTENCKAGIKYDNSSIPSEYVHGWMLEILGGENEL